MHTICASAYDDINDHDAEAEFNHSGKQAKPRMIDSLR
jgi:hypothetical protein